MKTSLYVLIITISFWIVSLIILLFSIGNNELAKSISLSFLTSASTSLPIASLVYLSDRKKARSEFITKYREIIKNIDDSLSKSSDMSLCKNVYFQNIQDLQFYTQQVIDVSHYFKLGKCVRKINAILLEGHESIFESENPYQNFIAITNKAEIQINAMLK